MAEQEKSDPLASLLGDAYTKLDPPAKAVAAGSFLKSRDEADKAARGEASKRSESQIISEFGPSLYSKPMEEFKPSQETAAGFAALGSLLMVAGGLFGGKGRMAGIGAMNNIAGMIKGYQSGRKDLYEQERQQFEENMKVQERNRADIKEAFNLALKMAPTNLRGAEEFMSKVFMSKGMNIPHEMMKTSGFTHTAGVMLGAIDKADNITKQIADSLGYKGVTSRKDLEARIAAQAAGTAAQTTSMGTGALEYGTLDGKTGMYTREQILSGQQKGQTFTPVAKPTARGAGSAPVAIIGEGGKPQLITRDEFERRTSAGEVLTPAPRSGAAGGGAVQFRYNTAITDATVAASMELKNIAESPLNAAPPVAAEALTNPVKSITQGVVDYFAQASTPAEDRAVQQMLSGLVRAQTAILGGGRPGGMTEAAINEIKAQAPRSGDSKINTYLFLALGKQVYEVALKDLEAGGATDAQMKIAKEARDEVNRIVPYTTQDINRILRGSGPMLINDNTVNLLKGSGTIGSFEDGLSDLLEGKSVVAPPPASSNVPTGAFKVGDPVVQGGKRYVVKQVDKDGKILSAVEEGAE
jgi:hypothetical protein